MNKVQQVSNFTKYDRYPEIMREVQSIVRSKEPLINFLRILSFGCSLGEEVKTLNNIYFPKHFIDGYDIREDIISKLQEKNKEKNIKFISDYKKLGKYDLIFCMSVLCVWPENVKKYTPDEFNKVIKDIDSLLKVGGYLVIYNSKYVLPQSVIGKKYEIVKTVHQESGFVKKYDMLTKKQIEKYPYFLFKKIIE